MPRRSKSDPRLRTEIARLKRQVAQLESQASGTATAKDQSLITRDITDSNVVAGHQVVINLAANRAPDDFLTQYLLWLDQTHAALRVNDIIKGVVSTDADPLELAWVFVDLQTTLRIPKDSSLKEHWLRGSERHVSGGKSRRQRSFFDPESMGASEGDGAGEGLRSVGVFEPLGLHPRLALIGDPGSGKSTVGQFLTLAMARSRLGNPELRERLGSTWTHGDLLPVPFVLREFAAKLGSGEAGGVADDLWVFLRDNLKDCGQEPDWTEAIKDSAKNGALYVFDGWDETHDPRRLARVAEALVHFVKNAAPTSRFLLTSRPYAWEAVNLAAAGQEDALLAQQDPALASRLQRAFSALHQIFAATYEVAPLADPQIQEFIKLWYTAVQSGNRPWFGQRAANEKRADLELAAAREDLQAVVSNPLLLTLTAALSGTHLPDDRADLFNEIVELLLKRWTDASGSIRSLRDELGRDLKLDDLREKIEEAALAAHHGHVGKEGPADIPEVTLQAGLASLLGGSRDLAAKVINFIEQRTGLLIGKGLKAGQRQFCCPHRNLQEFLAGCCLAAKPSFTCTDPTADPEKEPSAFLLARANPGHWREVLAFAARRAKYERGTLAAETLVHGERFEVWERTHRVTESDWRCAVVAALQLVEVGLEVSRSTPQTSLRVERVATWLVGLMEHEGLPSLRERMEAAQLLGRLGDPRPGVGTTRVEGLTHGLPDLRWGTAAWSEEIPYGSFRMGCSKAEAKYDDEQPDFDCTQIGVPFRLSRHLITVAQFDCFVREGGYDPSRPHWTPDARAWLTEGKITGPDDTHPAVFQTPHHPRVGVSWFEAYAFCQWLHGQREHLGIPAHYVLRLPTEAEWERAARNAEGRVFAWCGPGRRLEEEDWPAELTAHSNWALTKIGHTSPVGLFPSGAAACGALDLAGNVWEWCLTKWRDDYVGYDKKADQSPNGTDFRVLRGGSWGDYDPGYLRAAYRYNLGHPADRFVIFGFRVVCVDESR